MLNVAVPEDRGDVLRLDFQILIIHSEKKYRKAGAPLRVLATFVFAPSECLQDISKHEISEGLRIVGCIPFRHGPEPDQQTCFQLLGTFRGSPRLVHPLQHHDPWRLDEHFSISKVFGPVLVVDAFCCAGSKLASFQGPPENI
jgi:hypothetical protein